ncbi:MAG: TetR family transcriptional regulator [Burkholderiaceae bacterium]|nr:TetR family transcriptional regulator [Burkholderiaceae bacterium]
MKPPLPGGRAAVMDTGRVNQKQRTRQALFDAAGQLLAAGARPTLADVAEHALVSKATAYRYFASADALIAEVMFDRDFPSVEQVLGPIGNEPTTRVLAVEAAVNDALLSHEQAMRMIVRNAIDMTLAETDGTAHRTGRRQALIAAAVEPLAKALKPAAIKRLRHALALVIGPEAILAARDVCGLSPQETRKVTRWAAEAIVAHAMTDGARAGGR